MPATSTASSRKAPARTLDAPAASAAEALWKEARRRGALKLKGVSGNEGLRTLELAAGKQLLQLRVAHPRRAGWLAAEAWALGYLAEAGLAPSLVASSAGTPHLPRPHHLLELPGGTPLTGTLEKAHAVAVGALIGRLHDETGVALRLRAPQARPTSLMATFQALSDDLKTYLARREKDGLPQDLLTLSLSDLIRALRRYVVAAEHHFLPPPPRVLCHGALEPARILAGPRGSLCLWGFEHAHSGDGAADLAQLCERAALSDAATLALVEGYQSSRGRRDVLLIPRLCALRVLFRLRRAVDSLRALQDLVDLMDDGLAGREAEVDAALQAAREHLRLAVNGLMDFTGPARPLSAPEVEGLGALVGLEELQLRGRRPLVAIEGPPYTGKTPLAQELAARLRVPWIGVAALFRGAAGAAARAGRPDATGLVAALEGLQVVRTAAGLEVKAEGGEVVGSRPPEGELRIPDELSHAPEVQRALRALVQRVAAEGGVVEGAALEGLLPAGTRRFVLWASPEVRAARREAHLESLPPQAAEARRGEPDPLEGSAPTPPAAPPGAVVVDGSQLSVSQQVRTILRTLTGTPPGDDLTGRPVLFS
ncbi:MAG: (d)CMP kinase [Myxococcota bacterium]